MISCKYRISTQRNHPGQLFLAPFLNMSEEVDVWMDYAKGENLYWRPPLDVPAEGLVATLFFKLSDGRGGSDWVWGKVKVVRSDGAVPR